MLGLARKRFFGLSFGERPEPAVRLAVLAVLAVLGVLGVLGVLATYTELTAIE